MFLLTPFRAVGDFVGRHKKKVLGGSAIALGLGGYYVYKKVKPIIDDIRKQIKLMESLEGQRNNDKPARKQMLAQRFQHSMKVGDVTLRSFLAQTREQLTREFDLDLLRSKMKKKEGNEKERTEADFAQWDTFKLWGFARSFSAVYCVCLLNALIKIQLSIVSRYVLTDSAAFPNVESRAGLDAVNKRFFALSEYAQTKGLAKLSQLCLAVVTQVMSRWQLGMMCSAQEMQEMISEIRRGVEFKLKSADRAFSPPSMEESKEEGPQEDDLVSFLFPPWADLEAQIAREFAASESAASSASASASTSALTPSPSTLGSTASGAAVVGDSSPQSARFAVIRFAEMVAEAKMILTSKDFSNAVQSSFSCAFELVASEMQIVFKPKAAAKDPAAAAAAAAPADVPVPAPFPNVMIRMAKLFNIVYPESAESPPTALMQSLAALKPLMDVCSVVYMPLEISLDPTPNDLSVLASQPFPNFL